MKINDAKEYIKINLKKIIKSLPEIRVSYEYDIDAKIHSIEILPNKIYHLDKNYIDWEINFTDNFIKKFPDQNVCFFTDDAVIGIEKAEFEIIGEKYIDKNSENTNSKYKKLVAKKSKKEIHYN